MTFLFTELAIFNQIKTACPTPPPYKITLKQRQSSLHKLLPEKLDWRFHFYLCSIRFVYFVKKLEIIERWWGSFSGVDLPADRLLILSVLCSLKSQRHNMFRSRSQETRRFYQDHGETRNFHQDYREIERFYQDKSKTRRFHQDHRETRRILT